jgi:geranylgeranyl pyrophosphate synthase
VINSAIQNALKNTSFPEELSRIMDYAVFPAGKLFRPRLVMALASDLKMPLDKVIHLAAAIELHHAYTLVHDDLPAMDNDAMRRGKASTHAQFGEWKAILAGDALLISSFHEVQKTMNPDVQKLFTWATGARGLVLGQFLDLSTFGELSLKEVVRIHELKTSRLLQVATLGTYQLSTQKKSLRDAVTFFRLGRDIGVSFQLLDDLDDLNTAELSSHEKSINPFLNHPESALQELKLTYARLQTLLATGTYPELKLMLDQYFGDSKQKLLAHLATIGSHFEGTLWIGDLKTFLNKSVI